VRMRIWLALAVMVCMVSGSGAAKQEARIAPRGVELTALDGTKLKGTFYQAAGAGPGVLLLHQCNQTRKNWEGLATQLQAAGLNVFTVDYRGYGESGGTPMKELKPEEWRPMVEKKFPGDVDVALEYLEAQPVVTRHIIGIGGASCSVNQAIQAASRHPEVKTLVLLSGTTDHTGRAFLRKAGKVPMLFVVSDDDKDVSWKFTQWLYSLSRNPGSRFVHYQTGGHGTELFEAHKGLPGTIVDWFVQTLIKTPGSAPPTPGERPSTSYAPDTLELIDTGDAIKVEAKLRGMRKNDPNAELFDENLVNVLGYEHLEQGDKKGAIEIFKLNVFAYPASANVYDSLSDGYMADGEKALARENVEKSLQVLEKDTTTSEEMRKMIRESAAKKLKELGTAKD
jgi:dienelactone hydrolase